jgi:hypothetical protein
MKRDAFDKMMMVELAIMLMLFALIIIFSGCSGLQKVAPPLQGGKADLVVSGKSPGIKVSQPENSQAPTLAEYSREMIPVLVLRTNLLTESSNVFAPSIFDNTNWVVVRETYKTSIGEHQKDVAREGWVGVQKAAAVISKMQPVMYAGIILIIAAIVMSYFQAKYPAVFAPGLKIIALTFCTGLTLTILPAMTQNQTLLIAALIGGLAIVISYIFAKNLNSNTKNE